MCIAFLYRLYEIKKEDHFAYHKKIRDADEAAAAAQAHKKRLEEEEEARQIKAIEDKKIADRKALEDQQNAIVKSNALRKINMHITNIRGYLRQIDEGETKPAVILNSIDEEFSLLSGIDDAALYVGDSNDILKKLDGIAEFLAQRGFENDFVCAEIREFTEKSRKLFK